MNDSNIAGVSVRAWVTMFIVITVCTMSWASHVIEEPLYTLATIVVGFYFGRSTGKQEQTIVQEVQDNKDALKQNEQTN